MYRQQTCELAHVSIQAFQCLEEGMTCAQNIYQKYTPRKHFACSFRTCPGEWAPFQLPPGGGKKLEKKVLAQIFGGKNVWRCLKNDEKMFDARSQKKMFDDQSREKMFDARSEKMFDTADWKKLTFMLTWKQMGLENCPSQQQNRSKGIIQWYIC